MVSGTKLLLDTNIVLYLLSGEKTVAEVINRKQIYLSFITELELLGYSELTEVDEAQITSFLNECAIVNITEQIKEKTIEFRRTYKLKLPDCIIAATSQFLGIPLMTADTDFTRVEDINVALYNVNESTSDNDDEKKSF